ncbi:MAG: hypothetical protein IT372_16360 [Polyangiaceae bacterium]|nr:hypothetical protein [Polyangiaceae bacterium]
MARTSHPIWLSLFLVAAAPAALAACSKSTSYPAEGAVAVADFPAGKTDAWVNGQPFSFSAARGDVVLVEAWHRQ